MGVRRHVSGNLYPTQGALLKKRRDKKKQRKVLGFFGRAQPLRVQDFWAGTEPSKFICLSASSQVSMSGIPVP